MHVLNSQRRGIIVPHSLRLPAIKPVLIDLVTNLARSF